MKGAVAHRTVHRWGRRMLAAAASLRARLRDGQHQRGDIGSQLALSLLLAAFVLAGTVTMHAAHAQSRLQITCQDSRGNTFVREVTSIDPTCNFGETQIGAPEPIGSRDRTDDRTDCDTAVGCLNRPPTRQVPSRAPNGGASQDSPRSIPGPSLPELLTPSGSQGSEPQPGALDGPPTSRGQRERIAGATAAGAAVLVGSGVVVATAQAVASAIANALQAGGQMSAEEIQTAIAEALSGRGQRGEAPPEPQESTAGDDESAKDSQATAPTSESDEARAEREARERAERERQEWEAEQARRKAEAERLAKIQDLAVALGDDDFIERTVSQRIYNPDGSVNTEYLERLQEILRDRLRRAAATADPDFEDNSLQRIIQETLGQTMDEAKDSFIIRAGTGFLSGGTSEILFQGHSVVQKVQQAAEDSVDKGTSMSRADATRIAMTEFANENLPVNTAQAFDRWREGKNVGKGEVAMSVFADLMALTDVGEAVGKHTGIKPGEAFDAAARRVLPKDVYDRGAESVQQIGREVRDRVAQVGARVQDMEARGTEALQDNRWTGSVTEKVGLGGQDRLNPAEARARLDSGRVSTETQVRIDEARTKGPTAELDQAHVDGRRRGEQKVENFEQSLQRLEEVRNSGDPETIARAQQDVRNDMIRLQADKHGMNALNARNADGGGHRTIESFNGEMGAAHGQTDDAVRERLAEMYGVRPEDVQVVNITNEAGSGPRVDPASRGRPDAAGHASSKTPDGRIENSRAAPSEPGTIDGPDTGRLPEAEERPPRSDKAGMDRDLTMRVRTLERTKDGVRVVYRDVPSTVTARVYNEEWYRAATGKEPPPLDSSRYGPNNTTDFIDTHLDEDGFLGDPVAMEDPQAFARRTDQATTDRLHPEAYGTGQGDLNTATKDSYRHVDLSDAAGTAKTIEYKVNHWMKDASTLEEMAKKPENLARRIALLEQASAHMEEAQRQLVKQYGNMVVTRTEAMRMFGNAPNASIPAGMAEKVNVLRQVQQGRLSPAQAETVLKEMGSSTQHLASQMSSYVEGLQTLRSPSGIKTPATGSPFPMQGWKDEFREDDR